MDLKAEMFEALKAQHEAIDRLFARLIDADRSFYPTQSGQPWQGLLKGKAAIERYKREAAE